MAPADLGVNELRPRNLDELFVATSSATPVQSQPSVSALSAPRKSLAADLNSSTSTIHGGEHDSSRHSLRGSVVEEEEHEHDDPAGTGFAL